MKKYTWNKDREQEVWMHDIFDTVEECMEDAKEHGYVVGETIAVGEVQRFGVYVNAESVLDMLQADAYDECGESSDDWIDCRGHNLDALSDKLTECVNEWLKETNQEPTFYSIHSVSIETIK